MDTNTITIEKLKVYNIGEDTGLQIQIGSLGQVYISCKDATKNLVFHPLDTYVVRIESE